MWMPLKVYYFQPTFNIHLLLFLISNSILPWTKGWANDFANIRFHYLFAIYLFVVWCPLNKRIFSFDFVLLSIPSIFFLSFVRFYVWIFCNVCMCTCRLPILRFSNTMEFAVNLFLRFSVCKMANNYSSETVHEINFSAIQNKQKKGQNIFYSFRTRRQPITR